MILLGGESVDQPGADADLAEVAQSRGLVGRRQKCNSFGCLYIDVRLATAALTEEESPLIAWEMDVLSSASRTAP